MKFYLLIEIQICFPQNEYIHIRIRMKISRTNIFVFGPEKNIRSPLPPIIEYLRVLVITNIFS